MTGEFNGKVALVTGAGMGIGRAIALAFAEKGARVAVSDISRDTGEQTAKDIRDMGGEAAFIKADMAESEEVADMVKSVIDEFGRLDMAVNNAGIEGDVSPVVDYPEDVWDRVIRINLKGVWLCMKHEIPHMLRQGGGAIVNLSSIAGLKGFPGMSAYCATKHGVNGITKVVAAEHAGDNIRVNSVCPGFINTEMVDRLLEKQPDFESVSQATPAARMGTPEEIAQSVVWLCSDAASYVTGINMAVDGGFTM